MAVCKKNFILDKKVYKNKVLGGWLGKSIGGTLGGPYEGRKEILNLSFYDPVPESSLPNDDLDLQLVWLHVLKTKGPNFDVNDLAEAWLSYITYPYDEYGVAISNLKKGLRPPISGFYNNFFQNCMGAPIRSEIWAFISPGQPLKAMEFAYQDAVVDHAFDGVYGEVFLAVIESMAFIENRVDVLIEYGLAAIPKESLVAKAVRDTVNWYSQGLSWLETRERILLHYGNNNFTDCPQNIAFIILGWLYGGSDFEKSITTAVNCGYDTDCTGATLGAILGVIGGSESIPQKWKEPIGSEVIVGSGVTGIEAPKTLSDLTDLTCNFGEELFAEEKADLQKVRNRSEELNKKYYHTLAYYRDNLTSYVVDYINSPVLSTEKAVEIKDCQAGISKEGKLEIPLLPPVCWRVKLVSDDVVQAQHFWLTESGDLRLTEVDNACEIHLETFVYFSELVKLKLLVDINGRTEVRVNGKLTHSYHNHQPLLPAPHRCPPEDIALVDWQQGWNKVSIKITKCCRECANQGWFLIADLANHLDTTACYPASIQELQKIAKEYENSQLKQSKF